VWNEAGGRAYASDRGVLAGEYFTQLCGHCEAFACEVTFHYSVI
jgi:hypothetical protein